MEATLEVLGEAGRALLGLLTQPFYYIGVLLVVLQIRRQINLERKLFHLRLHAFFGNVGRMLLWGWIAGLAVSLPMLWLGSLLTLSALCWLWGTALVLSLLGIRFLCFAYAAGIVSLAHLAADAWLDAETVAAWEPAWLGDAVMSLSELHLPSLLALTALIHAAEALLMRLQGTKLALPLYVEGKRGKLIGAYQMQGFWPAPLFLMVPAAGGGLSAFWTPWFGAEGVWSGGWMLLAFPVLFGYAESTAALLPGEKLRRSSIRLLLCSVVPAGAALASEWYGWAALATAVLLILMHEVIGALSRAEEKRRAPRYVNDARGLCVLGVMPGGPADELGIRVGEIIHRVNGMPVQSKAGLHRALRMNAAFVKLEVLNLQGEKKFLQRALYEKEHHLLGMIVAPDNSAQYYVERRQPRLWSYLAARLPGTRLSAGAAADVGFVTADPGPAEVKRAAVEPDNRAGDGGADPVAGEAETDGSGTASVGGEGEAADAAKAAADRSGHAPTAAVGSGEAAAANAAGDAESIAANSAVDAETTAPNAAADVESIGANAIEDPEATDAHPAAHAETAVSRETNELDKVAPDGSGKPSE
jgi:hypothetical protein